MKYFHRASQGIYFTFTYGMHIIFLLDFLRDVKIKIYLKISRASQTHNRVIYFDFVFSWMIKIRNNRDLPKRFWWLLDGRNWRRIFGMGYKNSNKKKQKSNVVV